MDTIEDTRHSVSEMIANLDLYGLVEDLAQNPGTQNQRVKDIDAVVRTIIERDKQPIIYKQANEGNRRGETVLHTAIKRLQFTSSAEKEVLEILLDAFPKMLHQDRLNTEYAGQTVLHMAVTKGNIWVANTLLSKMSKKEHKARKSALLKRLAVGAVFTNTVMMAELPLNIAAVTCNKGMFDLLIEHGAELDGTNRHGDNVCHSLIRYALLYPEKLQDVLEMCQYISEDPAPYDSGVKATVNRKLRKKIWLMENKDGYNPLQLAAKFGQHDIFTFIMNLEGYCCENVNDGLFDIKIFDVTEIDAISYMTQKERTGLDVDANVHKSVEDVPGRRVMSDTKNSCKSSTLQMLLHLEPGCAFQFLIFPPLRRIIDKKWEMYRWYFYPWFLFHFLFMCFLTWYGIERSQQVSNSKDGYDIYKNPVYKRDMFHDGFGIAYGVIGCVVGSIYLFEAIIRLANRHMSWTLRSFTSPYGNGSFQIMFVLFGMLLIIDLPLAIRVRSYENYLLLIAIILGWFLFLFFLRALRPFSFFTVMIQKVLIGDLFRFSVILLCELVGFSTAIYMAIQGSNDIDSEFDNFGKVIVSMFKLMVGLGEIGILYNARHPVLVILLFISFIVLTTILMINSLIAMLSRTCTELVENVGTISARDMHWKLQRLSVVLYIESILPTCLVKCVGRKQEMMRYNDQLNKRNKVTRYMMEIRSLQTEDRDNKEDTISASWGFRTAQFNALVHRQALRLENPLTGIRDTFTNLVHRRRKHKDESEDIDIAKNEKRSSKKSKSVKIQSGHHENTENKSPQQVLSQNQLEEWRGNNYNSPRNAFAFSPSFEERSAAFAQTRLVPYMYANQESVLSQASQYNSQYQFDNQMNNHRVYMHPTHVHQMQMVDLEMQQREDIARARTTPLQGPVHVEEAETSEQEYGKSVLEKKQDVAIPDRAYSPTSRQSPEKLEIYHIKRCKDCSAEESIA